MPKKAREEMGKLEYVLRYRTKELLAAAIIVIIAMVLIFNVSYDRQNGFSWRAVPVNVNVEIKK